MRDFRSRNRTGPMIDPESRPAGRPRDSAAGPALLAAAPRLVIAHGYENVSIQMIAAAVHVGRQTLYRRWPSKAELVLDAFLDSAQTADALPDNEGTAAGLQRFFERLFANLTTDGPAIR